MEVRKCTMCHSMLSMDKFPFQKKSLNKRHPQCKQCRKFIMIKHLYGIDRDIYMKMYKEQNGKCWICGKKYPLFSNGTYGTLCVDHDHKTGKVRKLLCHSCNVIINERININILYGVIDYMRRYGIYPK